MKTMMAALTLALCAGGCTSLSGSDYGNKGCMMQGDSEPSPTGFRATQQTRRFDGEIATKALVPASSIVRIP
jgi:hypothetical protein